MLTFWVNVNGAVVELPLGTTYEEAMEYMYRCMSLELPVHLVREVVENSVVY